MSDSTQSNAPRLLDDYLTLQEAAAECDSHPATFRRWIALGEGPDITLLGMKKKRVHRADLRRWLEGRKHTVAP